MGPVHEVRFGSPFAVGQNEVTFAEYDRFVLATWRKLPSDQGWGRKNRPVINVAWDDTMAYAEWLYEQTGQHYRLPSEAEWEYAARGGTTTIYWWGDEVRQDGKVRANCSECGSQWDLKQTAPVGSFAANPFGLQDTAGNVWEWVEDCWHDRYQGAPSDGSAWEKAGGGDCSQRVVRGGSWGGRPGNLRSAGRDWSNTVFRPYFIGFRLAQDP